MDSNGGKEMKHYDGSYRSTREAFVSERFPAVFGPYRRAFLSRAARLASHVMFWTLLAGLGVLMAWRG
jgi:hypothetical protein